MCSLWKVGGKYGINTWLKDHNQVTPWGMVFVLGGVFLQLRFLSNFTRSLSGASLQSISVVKSGFRISPLETPIQKRLSMSSVRVRGAIGWKTIHY